MNLIQHRLKDFIKHKNMSVRAFESQCGLSYGYIGNMRQSIQPDKICNIAQCFPDLSTGWLLTGEGQMIKSNEAVELFANRLSEIIIDIDSDLSSIATSFGLTAVELANFTNNFEWPQCPFDFVEFLKEYPEYSYQWILTGLGPKFNGDEEQCLKAVKQRAFENAHPEFYPNKAHQDVRQDSNDQLWKQIAFQNEQLKDRDEQIKQLLNIIQEKAH